MAFLALVLIIGLATLVGQTMGSVNWAFAASIILLIVLNRFFLPISYDGTGDALVARWPLGSRSIPWSDVRRFDAGTDGGILRSRASVSAFDLRAVPLMFPADVDHAKRLRAAIRDRIDQDDQDQSPAADSTP